MSFHRRIDAMIYLVRHGESVANVDRRFCGITDVELSCKGKKQSLEAGLMLKKDRKSVV